MPTFAQLKLMKLEEASRIICKAVKEIKEADEHDYSADESECEFCGCEPCDCEEGEGDE